MSEPDFEQIAGGITEFHYGPVAWTDDAEYQRWKILKISITAALRQVWNAGKDAAGQRVPLAKHLINENTDAHLALDRLGAATTKSVPTRDGAGKQDATIGLAERIDLAQRQVWNARGAADIAAINNTPTWYTATLTTHDRDGSVMSEQTTDNELTETFTGHFIRAIRSLNR